MSDTTKSKLKQGHNEALGIKEKRLAPRSVEDYYARNEHLKEFPTSVLRKAWFTLAHLLLEPGAHVLDMGCTTGVLSYAMATLNPDIKITAIDLDKGLIKEAKKMYKRPNLTFLHADINSESLVKQIGEPVDAIINSFILHNIYSNAQYDDRPVISTLERQFDLLKPGGQIFIRDYAMPPPGEYVLLEMPDIESTGKNLNQLSEADLLVWYSENARPREEKGCDGFFLEELPPRFPQTRLFRLPYKWAYEFIMRKDDRASWENELPKEYTFFTQREYRKNLRALGARVLFTMITEHLWEHRRQALLL
jgi:SAM-dependent methyltransferase